MHTTSPVLITAATVRAPLTLLLNFKHRRHATGLHEVTSHFSVVTCWNFVFIVCWVVDSDCLQYGRCLLCGATFTRPTSKTFHDVWRGRHNNSTWHSTTTAVLLATDTASWAAHVVNQALLTTH